MVGLVAMVAIMMILAGQATQEWADVLRRENEAEMMFRAQEIVRGIIRYQAANGRLPTKLEELMDPGPKGQYFMRREYDDPLVPDGKWGLLYAGPGGNLIDPSSPGVADPSLRIGEQSSVPITAGGGLQGGQGQGGPLEIGGLAIAGVKTLCEDQPFRVHNGSTDYSQWLFSIYDAQRLGSGAPGAGGGAPGSRPGVGAPGRPGAGGAIGGPGGGVRRRQGGN